MTVDWKYSSTGFTIEGVEIPDAAGPRIASLVNDIGRTLQSFDESIRDLQIRDDIDDGQRRAMMALVLKIEILTRGLRSQADVLNQMRNGEISPTEAGFPEFEAPYD